MDIAILTPELLWWIRGRFLSARLVPTSTSQNLGP
ncbi:unnamed protein product [Penicillium camemberti]|uniref:Str. FM013 n=1 Tax=Penicillium camemberti (strain FM 013) TaxID=1429867 RepID=A0A0G4PMY3_PENC3|nr:unnamed protein product [Penicillium camemberti]